MNYQQLETRQSIRMSAEDRYLTKLEKLENLAAPLIGELIRNGATIYYINLTNRNGDFTGKTKESTSHSELVDYLTRNKYIVIH